MSESAPERTGGGGSFLTRKVGPLPMWGWGAIVLLLAVFYAMYSKKKSAAASASTSNSSTVDSPGGVDSSLVPQFVNQVYTQGTPPAAPNVTVNNTVPPPSSPGGTSTPPTATQKVNQYPAPQGLTASKVSSTSLKASWNNITSPMPAPASYTVAVYQGGKVVEQQTVTAPDTVGGKSTVTLTGLPANASGLQVHVWPNGGALAPQHASSTVNL
jgi:hypothetical protein